MDSTVRTKGYTPFHDRIRKCCEDCKYFNRVGAGSISQQETVCTKLEIHFNVSYEDICDEFEEWEEKEN